MDLAFGLGGLGVDDVVLILELVLCKGVEGVGVGEFDFVEDLSVGFFAGGDSFFAHSLEGEGGGEDEEGDEEEEEEEEGELEEEEGSCFFLFFLARYLVRRRVSFLVCS